MSKKEVIASYFEALSKGDVPKVFSYFDANIKWHQPGRHKFSGVKKNTDEIGAMLGKMMQETAGSLVVKPNGSMMESGDLVAAPVRFTATKGSQSMDMGGTDLFEVKGDKITQVWLFSEDQEKENEFWEA